VQALHSALDDLSNVHGVVHGRSHSADVDAVELLAALNTSLASQSANRVADVHSLAAGCRDVNVVGFKLDTVVFLLLLAHAAVLLAVDPGRHLNKVQKL